MIWWGMLPKWIISKSADTAQLFGMIFGWNQQVELSWLRTSGFNDTGRAGINARKYVDIRMNNVHDDGSYWGFDVQTFSNYSLNNCAFKYNTESGINELFLVGRTIDDEGYTVVVGAGKSGLNSKEFCAGHLDTLITAFNAGSGIETHSGFTANVGGLELYGNPIGVTGTGPGELHVENSIVWGAGVNANIRAYNIDEHFHLLSRSGWNNNPATHRPLREGSSRFYNGTAITISTTATQEYVLGTLFKNEHATAGQVVKARVSGRRTTGSNGTLQANLRMGSINVCTVVLPTTAAANAVFSFEFEIECYQDGDFQRVTGWGFQEGASGYTGDPQQNDRTEAWVANDRVIRVDITQSSASDATIINHRSLKA